jgi:arylsulfatase A-like enzyme
VEHANALSLIQGDWKYIEPNEGPRVNVSTNTEMGNDPQPQLYYLKDDLGEKNNVAAQYPERVREMASLLQRIRQQGRSRAPS